MNGPYRTPPYKQLPAHLQDGRRRRIALHLGTFGIGVLFGLAIAFWLISIEGWMDAVLGGLFLAAMGALTWLMSFDRMEYGQARYWHDQWKQECGDNEKFMKDLNELKIRVGSFEKKKATLSAAEAEAVLLVGSTELLIDSLSKRLKKR